MRVLLVAAVVVLVALSGCSKKSPDSPGGVPFETPHKEDGDYHITLTADKAFDPRNAKVPDGAVVVWTAEIDGCRIIAKDGAFDSRNGRSESGVSYNNGIIPKGESFTWTAISSGDHEYVCSVYEGSGMVGVLRVG